MEEGGDYVKIKTGLSEENPVFIANLHIAATRHAGKFLRSRG